MVEIEPIRGPTARSIAQRPATRPYGASFVLPSETEAADQAGFGLTHEVSLASVLTLQEMHTETVEDREAKRHGEHVLAVLARLQRDLLAGLDGGSALQELAVLTASVPLPTDRSLAAVLATITTRARIELARQGS